MESNWRYNVADLGWADSDFVLIARLPDPNPFGYYVWKRVGPMAGIYIGYTAFTLDDEMIPVLGLISLTAHFPAGINVMPD